MQPIVGVRIQSGSFFIRFGVCVFIAESDFFVDHVSYRQRKVIMSLQQQQWSLDPSDHLPSSLLRGRYHSKREPGTAATAAELVLR